MKEVEYSLDKQDYAKNPRPSKGVRVKNRAKQKYEGMIVETLGFGKCIVKEYIDCYTILVEFEDGTVVSVSNSQVLQGSIKNPNMPFVSGVGFVGQGEYSNKNNPECYKYWNGIMERAYCPKYHQKRPTYKDCTVVNEWHNFQNFAKWFYKQVREEGWELDKDLLVKGNREYGPDTCCFVPRALNILIPHRKQGDTSFPIGVHESPNKGIYISGCNDEDGNNVILGFSRNVEEMALKYKVFKESVIKKVAERWKDRIDVKLYGSLMAWEI